jgi:NADH-quinone oxidoreductase subunit H
MKFGMFFLTDFLETIVVASLSTTLFFGGWQVPYLLPDGFHFPWGGFLAVPHLVYVLLGVTSFTIKVLSLGWKGLFPIAVANIVVTALILVFFGGTN